MTVDNDKEAAELWRIFLVLTQEMDKFIEQDNVDMFLDLLEQRLALQKKIEALDNRTYHLSAAGREIIGKIGPIDADIRYKSQRWLNKTKKSQAMARAYDSLGYDLTGYTLNKSF